MIRTSCALLAFLAIACSAYAQPAYTYKVFDFPGSHGTVATGINDAGDIVGFYYDRYDYTHGFLRSGGRFTTVDFPNSMYQTTLHGINNCGSMVGQIFYNSGNTVLQSFVLQKGQFTLINYPGSLSTLAFGINDHGAVSGSYEIAEGINNCGYLWFGGIFHTISTPADSSAVVMGTDNRRDLAGYYLRSHCTSGCSEGFAYFGETGAVLPIAFPGASDTGATGINVRGQVVGYYSTPTSGGAFVYDRGVITALHPSGTFGSSAWAINSQGVIVGQVTSANGSPNAFIATPAGASAAQVTPCGAPE